MIILQQTKEVHNTTLNEVLKGKVITGFTRINSGRFVIELDVGEIDISIMPSADEAFECRINFKED